ncbi:hypothetical protein [Streptodolium elevatio]|uniref:Uncharacterized protein n=1 Tax=Streptodolium elevatio TaxID=3157996 RepID=A0ABV3DTZ4_9ACTN
MLSPTIMEAAFETPMPDANCLSPATAFRLVLRVDTAAARAGREFPLPVPADPAHPGDVVVSWTSSWNSARCS